MNPTPDLAETALADYRAQHVPGKGTAVVNFRDAHHGARALRATNRGFCFFDAFGFGAESDHSRVTLAFCKRFSRVVVTLDRLMGRSSCCPVRLLVLVLVLCLVTSYVPLKWCRRYLLHIVEQIVSAQNAGRAAKRRLGLGRSLLFSERLLLF